MTDADLIEVNTLRAIIAKLLQDQLMLRDALDEIVHQDTNHASDIRCKCTDADKLSEVRLIANAALKRISE